MKKFILLFAVAFTVFSALQAQEITKILGKTGFQPTYVNLETDTLVWQKGTSIYNLTVNFALEYTNGETPLAAGDSIVMSFKLGSDFISHNDTMYHKLMGDLGANETVQINFPMFTLLEGEFSKLNDSLYRTTSLSARIFYTTKFTVPQSGKNPKTILGAYFVFRTPDTPPSAISETEMQSIKLYPNPVNSDLTIANLKDTKVEIFNVVGQRIINFENVNGNINVNMVEYPNGIYFVKMQSGKAVRTEKIKLIK